MSNYAWIFVYVLEGILILSVAAYFECPPFN